MAVPTTKAATMPSTPMLTGIVVPTTKIRTRTTSEMSSFDTYSDSLRI
jgi:hypothetical protein